MQPTILSLQQLDNLAVIQFSTKPFDTLEYISMENAMKTGSIEVTESSEQGSVNQLSVNNRSKVLLLNRMPRQMNQVTIIIKFKSR